MTNASNVLFSSNIEQTEIESILKRIDENLALRSVLREQATSDPQVDAAPEPIVIDRGDVPERIAQLSYMQAPLFVVKGRRPAEVLKRVLNIPIRVFGYKQAMFNRDLLPILSHLVEHVQRLREYAGPQGRVAADLADLRATLHTLTERVSTHAGIMTGVQEQQRLLAQLSADMQSVSQRLDQIANDLHQQQNLAEAVRQDVRDQHTLLEQTTATQRGQQIVVAQLAQDVRGQRDQAEQVATEQRGQQAALNQLAQSVQGQHAWAEQIVADQRGQNAWMEQIVADQRGQSEWIKVLERKVQMLALDVREVSSPSATTQHDLPEPRIIDPDSYARKLAAMGKHVRVNLGSGEKPLDGYINVDFRAVADVDVVADVQRLPFELGSLAEITSAHLVEHFREHQFRTRILPYWHGLLHKDGILRIVCPDWEAMLKRLNDGHLSVADFKLLTFGGQDYVGDDHFAMYTPDTLCQLLRDVFLRVEIIATDRENGLCPEQEVVAYR